MTRPPFLCVSIALSQASIPGPWKRTSPLTVFRARLDVPRSDVAYTGIQVACASINVRGSQIIGGCDETRLRTPPLRVANDDAAILVCGKSQTVISPISSFPEDCEWLVPEYPARPETSSSRRFSMIVRRLRLRASNSCGGIPATETSFASIARGSNSSRKRHPSSVRKACSFRRLPGRLRRIIDPRRSSFMIAEWVVGSVRPGSIAQFLFVKSVTQPENPEKNPLPKGEAVTVEPDLQRSVEATGCEADKTASRSS